MDKTTAQSPRNANALAHRFDAPTRSSYPERMSFDTTAMNQNRQDFTGKESVWLFGYGSLLYKVDFPYFERKPARIEGWARRFWQGSHDHRGTMAHPGRVATLIRREGSCVGMAYRVAPAAFGGLDVREKNGYLRFRVPLHFWDGTQEEGLIYIATPQNAAWLGPASAREIAVHIAGCSGPSGTNRQYLLRLADALRALDVQDAHVFDIERELKRLSARTEP